MTTRPAPVHNGSTLAEVQTALDWTARNTPRNRAALHALRVMVAERVLAGAR